MPITTQATTAAKEQPHQMPRVTEAMAVRADGDRPRRMVRLTVNLPSDLVEEMRDAVYWTPGLTLAWMIAQAVRGSLAELKRAHQGPFPRRLKPLRAGRPRLLGQSMKIHIPLLAQSESSPLESMMRSRIVSSGQMK